MCDIAMRRRGGGLRRLVVVLLVLLLAACGGGAPATPTPSTEPEAASSPADATAAPSPAAAPASPPTKSSPAAAAVTPPAGSPAATSGATASATAAETATPPATADTRPQLVVSGTQGTGVRLRRSPGGDALRVYPEGTRLEQVGPDQDVAGVVWRNVRGPDGQEGWVAAEFTAAAPAAATPRRPRGSGVPTEPTTGPLGKYRLVTYYGHPNTGRMGILGEYPPQTMIAKLKEQAAAYTAADPGRPALCTVELIASFATEDPGRDGMYRLRTPPEVIEEYAQLAERNGCQLLLDVQMGYDSVANEVQAILPFLQRPYVHLAIDPEFHMQPGKLPGIHYGSVSAADVMAAGKVLGDLVTQHKLPDKVLVVHQFRFDMLPDKENIAPMPHVQLVVVMDGWGTPESKLGNYEVFVRDQLIQYGGIKLFYQQDYPLLTPEEIVKLDPVPLVVSYQ